MAAVRERVSTLLTGCKCITGCTTKRCSCQKKSKKKSSVGCECTNCSNIDHREEATESEIAEIVIDEEVSNDRRDTDIEDVMDWVFGNDAEQPTQEQVEEYTDSEFFD